MHMILQVGFFLGSVYCTIVACVCVRKSSCICTLIWAFSYSRWTGILFIVKQRQVMSFCSCVYKIIILF